MRPVYILGCGAVGFPLAAYLSRAGRRVIGVRTSEQAAPNGVVRTGVRGAGGRIAASVETVSLSVLEDLDGLIVVAAKSYANESIARALAERRARGPLVVMQNGLGVERAFVEAGLGPVFRCVLYVTSQAVSDSEYSFRPIGRSLIGAVSGDASELEACAATLSTEPMPFVAEARIERAVWKKAIVNSVFNSICPLLGADNGVFARDAEAAELARELVAEGAAVTERLGLDLSESELMEQIMDISSGSAQMISTLQDILRGRPTEIDYLSLAIARVAASLDPPLAVPRTALLGKLVSAKSRQPPMR